MRLIIIAFDEDPCERLIKWARFHRMDYDIVRESGHNTSCNDGYNIIITSDLLPNTNIFRYVFKQKEVGASYRIIKRNGKWRPSFCVVTSNPFSLTKIFDTYNDSLHMDESIVTDKFEGPLSLILNGSLERFDALWTLIMKDWYSQEKDYVSLLYYPMWIEAYHKRFLETGNRGDRVWIREQCCFSSVMPRTKVEGVLTISELTERIRNTSITFDMCLKGLEGYEVDVDVPNGMFSLHPFSIHGMYMARPVKKVDMDMSMTIVAFYYDLGYANKPKLGYYESMEYYVKIKYPIIFYGPKEECERFKRLREELISYTEVYPVEAEEWSLIKSFKDDFNEMDTDIDYRKRRRYALLTCNKIYAVMDAIKRNPFHTDKFCWYDPGIYRHELAAGIKLEEVPFQNFDVKEYGIAVLVFCMSGGSNEQEFKEGHESMISNIIAGTTKSWERLFEEFDKLVIGSFRKGMFFTEQVMLTRLANLYPELFDFREFTYHGKSINAVLKLEWIE